MLNGLTESRAVAILSRRVDLIQETVHKIGKYKMETTGTTKNGIARLVGKLVLACLLIGGGYYAGHMNAISSRAASTDQPGTTPRDGGPDRGTTRVAGTRRLPEPKDITRDGDTVTVRVPHYSTEEIAEIEPKLRSVEQLLLMAEDCPLAEFGLAWDLIEETGLGEADRIKVLARLCSYIAAGGGLEVVLAKIKAMPESGESKNELISASFFGSDREAAELMGKLGDFDYGDERMAALSGIAAKIRMSSLEKLDLSRYPELKDVEIQKTIGKALGERMSNASRGEKSREFTDLFGKVRSYVASGKVSEALMGAFFRASADTAPVEAWEQWKLMGYGAAATDAVAFDKVSQKLALGLLRQGGEYAMQQLVVPDLAATPANAKLSGLAFYGWLKKDLNGATAWLSNQQAGFGGMQADSVYQASVQYNLENAQWDAAKCGRRCEWRMKPAV